MPKLLLSLTSFLFIISSTSNCSPSASVSYPEVKQPNIVFFFTDDHALQSIGAYGSKINKTPNIDRLANTGVTFINSFCANSICGPSRACILSGKHSHKNGFKQNSDRFDGNQVTFPKLLQKAGYQTALIGKWHLHSDPQGFDHWEILPGQGSYYNPDFYTAEKNKKGKRKLKRYTGYCTDITTNLSLKWLEERDSTKPFMLMCQHKAPHRIWAPALKYLNKYDDVTIPEPATLFDNYENRDSSLKKNRMTIDKHFYYGYDLKIDEEVPFASKRERFLKNREYKRMNTEQKKAWDAAYGPKNKKFLKDAPKGKALVRWKYQRYIKDYLRCIDSVDENVGRVLDYLKEKGLDKNTIVIYSSDQGFYLGEHGWYDKRWMFEESFKMPFIIRWPGVTPAGTKNHNLIQNIDYGPTFLEAAGAAIPKEMQGKSLKKIITNPNADWRDTVYYHYYEHGSEHNVPRHEGVRGKRYKLINFYSGDGFNLFDLKKDPHEMTDESKNPAYKDILEEMKHKLAAQRKYYDLPPLQHVKKRKK